MADVYAGQACIVQMAEEGTFGTPMPDNSAAKQLQCVAPVFDFDTQIRTRMTANGQRWRDDVDFANDNKGAIPKLAITTDVFEDEMAYWLYGFFQNVTEEALTPFKKTFTLATPGADFASSEGIFYTFWKKAELAAQSDLFAGCLIQSLNLKCAQASDNARLVATANFMSFHPSRASRTADPSGTLTKAAQELFHWHNMARFKIGGVNITARSFELNFEKTLDWVGQDTNGDASNVAQHSYAITGKAEILWNAAAQTILAGLDAGTLATFQVGWGNATPGTVDGDLDFALYVRFTAGPKVEEGVRYVTLDFEASSKTSASTEICTVICADAIDRTW